MRDRLGRGRLEEVPEHLHGGVEIAADPHVSSAGFTAAIGEI